jgi:transcription antitermination factor NusG
LAALPPWFALTVKPQHEHAVERGLVSKGLDVFLPLYQSRRRWSDRYKHVLLPLFPGYVFCRLSRTTRVAALNVPGVRSLVSFGREPAAVPAVDIEGIRRMLASGYDVGPWPLLAAGQRVRVQTGPLSGLQGALVRVDGGWRVVVTVDVLQRSVSVQLPRDCVVPLPS